MTIITSKRGAWQPGNESGQSHLLGFALFLPLILFAAFFLLSLCWIGWQSVSIDHALYQTSWKMDAQKLDHALASSNPSETIHSLIVSDWALLDESKITVQNASIREVSTRENEELSGTGDRENMHIERIAKSARYARIQADVTYEVTLPLPLFGVEQIALNRHIDKTQQVTSRFEVS